MSQYFENELLKSDLKLREVKLNDTIFKFYTDNGVFSKKGLDFGTRNLLDNINLESVSGRVLDLGCGYGAIAIMLSKLSKAREIIGTDVNDRALHLAKKNAKLNKCQNTNFIKSDAYDELEGLFDVIITNPPIRAGKKILHKIVFGAKNHMKKSSELYIVINKNHGAKSLIKELEKMYFVEIINKNKGFFVIKCKFV